MPMLPDDKVGDHARSYFECCSFNLRLCSGNPDVYAFEPESSPSVHFRLEQPKRKLFYTAPSGDTHQQFGGNFGTYFTQSMATNLFPQTNFQGHCYRAVDGQNTCEGHCYLHQVYVSMPIMLCVSIPSPEFQWDFPTTLYPLKNLRTLRSQSPKLANSTSASIHYNLVARILGNGHHFVVRFAQEGGRIFHYDDLLSSGSPNVIKDGTCHTCLAGTDRDLRLLPGWSTHYALYHLHGGIESQSQIISHQIASIKKTFKLSVTQPHAGAIPVVKLKTESLFQQMSPMDCWWRSNPVAEQESEFVLRKNMSTSHREHGMEANSKQNTSTKSQSAQNIKHSWPHPPTAKMSSHHHPATSKRTLPESEASSSEMTSSKRSRRGTITKKWNPKPNSQTLTDLPTDDETLEERVQSLGLDSGDYTDSNTNYQEEHQKAFKDPPSGVAQQSRQSMQSSRSRSSTSVGMKPVQPSSNLDLLHKKISHQTRKQPRQKAVFSFIPSGSQPPPGNQLQLIAECESFI
jgi:hypothetical protein